MGAYQISRVTASSGAQATPVVSGSPSTTRITRVAVPIVLALIFIGAGVAIGLQCHSLAGGLTLGAVGVAGGIAYALHKNREEKKKEAAALSRTEQRNQQVSMGYPVGPITRGRQYCTLPYSSSKYGSLPTFSKRNK